MTISSGVGQVLILYVVETKGTSLAMISYSGETATTPYLWATGKLGVPGRMYARETRYNSK